MSINKNSAPLSLLLVLLLAVGVSSQCGGFDNQQCAGCDSNNVCTSCNTGYKLDPNNICLDCNIPNCNFCVLAGTCNQCLATFSMDNLNKTCIPCNLANCLACNTDNACSSCAPGFTTSDGQCFNCSVQNCISCTAADNICTTCSQFHSVVPSTGQCIQCLPAECVTCSSVNFCGQCSTNFSVSDTGTCVSCGLPNC